MLTGVHKKCLGDYLFDFEKNISGQFMVDLGSFRMMSFGILVKIGAKYSKWPKFDLK